MDERIILGAWLSQEHLEDIEIFEKNDFPEYEKIFLELKKENYDYYKISRNTGKKIEIITQLVTEYINNSFMYETCLNNLAKKKKKIMLMQYAHEESEKAYEQLDAIREWEHNRKAEITSDSNLAMSMLEEIDHRSKMDLAEWGIQALDNFMTCVMPSELTTIAARPGVGKSTIALQIAENLVKAKQKVIFLPLEMRNEALMARFIQKETGLKGKGFRTGNFSREEWDNVNYGLDKVDRLLKNKNFILPKQGEGHPSYNKLENIEMAIKTKPNAIFIDQLSQIETQKYFKSDREKLTYITRRLKALALQYNVAIVLMCQINREGQDRIPTLSNLKESGSIEEDSDNVVLIHRYSEVENQKLGYNVGEELTPVRIEVAKQREGPTGYTDMFMKNGRYQFVGIAKE